MLTFPSFRSDKPARWSLVLVALALVLLLAGCNKPSDAPAAPTDSPKEAKVQDGDKVSVNYRGTLDDGTEFDSSYGREPLSFTVGEGQLIPGFENAIKGLHIGGKVNVHIEPGDAYGERTDEMVFSVPRAQAPDGLKTGDQVQLSNGMPASIVEINDQEVRIDANHPLAGKALNFDIEVISINGLSG